MANKTFSTSSSNFGTITSILGSGAGQEANSSFGSGRGVVSLDSAVRDLRFFLSLLTVLCAEKSQNEAAKSAAGRNKCRDYSTNHVQKIALAAKTARHFGGSDQAAHAMASSKAQLHLLETNYNVSRILPKTPKPRARRRTDDEESCMS